MTRKKSNVKALALAVTCAILAGGYSGLNPVYAADAQKLYKANSGAVTTVADATSTPSTTEEITQITVGGVTLGDFGTSGGTGRIEASNVKISNNLTVGNNLNIGNDITISGSDGKLTVNAARINGNNTVTGILRVGEIKGLDKTDPTDSTVSGQEDLKINGATFKDGGKVAATSLEIGSAELTAEKLAALNSAVANDGKISAADGSTVGGVGFSNGAVTNVKSINADDQYAKFRVTEDDNSYTFRAGNLKITTAKENGQLNGDITFADTNRPNKSDEITLSGIINIRTKTDVMTNSSTSDSSGSYESTKIRDVLEVRSDGKVNVNGTLTAKSGSKIGNITISDGQLSVPYGSDTARVNVTDLADDHKIITEDTQYTYSSKKVKSKIDSLETSEAALTAKTQAIGRILDDSDNPIGTAIENKLRVYDNGTVTINEGAAQQVTIDSNGIKVGKNSSRMNDSTGFATTRDLYVGADNADAPTKDGSKFYVEGSSGDVFSKGNVTANQAGFNDLAVTNGLTVGDNDPNGSFVNMQNGSVVATGSVTAMGDLAAVGNLYVIGQSTFTSGVKTDKIEEATTGAGVTVDGVVLKDGGVNASAMSVTGATGSLNVKDIGGTSTMIYTKAADETNTIWIDPATGNISTNGTLQVGGGVAGTKPSVTIDGATGSIKVGQNDTEKFAVDGTTGNVKTEGSLEVAKNATVGGNLGVTGNATVGGTLGVTGKTTLNDALDVKGKATFGNAPGAMTEIDGDKFKTGVITTDNALESSIGGVKMANGKITADNMTITGTLDMDHLKVNETLEVGTFGVTKAGVVTGVTSINDVAVSKQGTGLKIGSATVGDSNPFSSQGYTVDATGNVSAKDITAGKYNGNEITADKKFNGVELNGGNVTATKVTADTLTDGQGFTAAGGNVTAKNIQAETGTIAGVNFAAGGNVSGINELTATTIKDTAGTIITGGKVKTNSAEIGAIKIDNEIIESTAANGLSIEGVKIKDGAISDVTSIDATKATIGGVNTLDNTGLTVATGSKVQVGVGTILTDGKVQVSDKTNLTDGSLELNDTNKWTQTGGLVADKATVNGIALGTDSKGKATFRDAAGNTTTIDGDKITTGTITADELNVDKISLGKDTDKNITIGSNGDVTTKGEIKITDAAGNVMTKLAKDSATFGKDADNQTEIDKGTIKAKAKSTANQLAELGFDENGLTVSGQNAEGKTSSFSFNAKTGANTFTGQDSTFTTINGSSVRSYDPATGAGHLNGATLNLWKDADNSTYMTAGGATFNGAAGEKGGTTTTINGGTITTDTLNVGRINLGGEVIDKGAAGVEDNSKLYMDAQGNFRAASGNFKVAGADGAMTNTVGNTTLKTDTAGAGMSYAGTVTDADGNTSNVTSNVSVGNDSAKVSSGASSIEVKNDGITNNGKTTFKGTSGETTIDGGTITTGKLITDKLVITGQGDAAGAGSGSIAFGGNGTIKSNIKGEVGTTDEGKETTFETKLDGVTTKVTDGTNTTINEVAAAGNTNTVTDGTATSKNTQTATSIGGVVTNGTVKIAQTLDGANGNITNEVTDKDGKSSKLVQNGTGLEYTDSTKADNATRINSSDVSIGSATDDSKRINLSDLGQIDDLDTELSARDEFKNNPTAVGGINAEAAVRREEVARLDNRIDDVNDRVNKVGAMAAAIASLKSIGYDPQAPSEFSVGLGQYKGETGVALGFFHYPNKNFMINVSLSTAGGETMGGIGATWRFGHKSPQKLLDEQRAAQAKKELAAAEKYKAAAQLAKEAQERAEYAAKLARQAQVSADNAKAAADATQAKHFN